MIDWVNEPAILSTVLDISERVQAEKALKKSNKQFQGLFTSMSSGVVFCKEIYDGQGNMVDCYYEDMNSSYEQFTNLDSATAIGQKVSEMLPGTESSWFEMFGRVVKTGNPIAFEMYHEQSGNFYSVYAYR